MSDNSPKPPESRAPVGARTITYRTPGAGGEESHAQLVIVEGPSIGKVFLLSSATSTVGRQDGCEITLPSITVSRQHATITRQANFYYVVDNRSSNGVYLNGQKLPVEQECLLHHGDLLRFGEYVLVFKHEEKLVDRVGLSTISLDSEKIRQEADEFLKEVAGNEADKRQGDK
jgi:pSer/pThr/pTyr-binding forkhead associated (FHA) protein